MKRDTNNDNRIPGSVKILLFLLSIVSIHFGRKYYIAYQHPYKDLDVIGTWDYAYSVTFDVDKNMARTDKDLFSLDMYTETEIELNDDGTFRINIEGEELTGTWEPEKQSTNILRLTMATPDMDGIIIGNEIRWDKSEDRLCIGLCKDSIPDKLKDLFQDNEEYRYMFCKTYREVVRIVNRDNDYSDYDEDYDEEYDDNGLPFNYHP